MEFLNDEARDHLKKLLEYLEAAEIPYTIDPTVVGSSDVWEYTLFDIREASEKSGLVAQEGAKEGTVCVQPRILAVGGRYSPFMRKAYKQGVDSVTVMLAVDGVVEVSKKELETPLPKSPFFFGHVSDVAKKVALNVLGRLREAEITVRHAVTRDTLSHQLTHVAPSESKQAPEYMIMIGHKEALDGTAIVRNEATRVQKEVPLTELASYLKRLAK
jgi:histidyl-tRNA synthetase